jgi:hypothetical protein
MGQAKSKADIVALTKPTVHVTRTNTFDMLPRFPQPFLERLAGFASWEDVLSLVSTCKREAPMREYWINEQSAAVMSEIGDHLNKFIARFPCCQVRSRISRSIAVVVKKKPDVLICRVCSRESRFKSASLLEEHILRKHPSDIGISTRYPCKSFSFKS